MKRYVFCLVGLLGLMMGHTAWSQAFVVPSKMKFADIDLTIDDNAKQQIQMRVNMLAQSPDAYQAFAERAQLYFPVIERVLEEERLPSDFKYVPLTESGLTADMTGRNNGVGFWLMTDTLALDNGLVINGEVDERKNIVTSTRAYSRYLQKCNYLMRNWFFSALAYPLGLNNSYMATDPNLRGANQLSVDDRYHPYFFNLLAHIIVFRDKLNLTGAAAPTVQLLVYNDTKGKTLEQVAKMTNVQVTEMVKYNPWLTAASVPASNAYPMLVPTPLSRVKEVTALLNNSSPAAEAKGFVSTAASPKADQNTSQEDVIYPVITNKTERSVNGRNYAFAKINGLDGMIGKEGYSIDEMAAVAGLKPAKFMKFNDMKTGDYIKKDHVYYVVAKNKTGPVKDHALLPGQSFSDVAQQYGVQLSHLKSLNLLSKEEAAMEGRVVRLQTKRGRKEPVEFRKVEQLTQEQKLVNRATEDNTMPSPLDTAKVNPPATNEQPFHAVQPGETIYTISQKFGVLPSDLVRWNNLVGFNVEPGDLIRIKGDPAVASNPLPNTNGQGTPVTNGQNWPNNELPVLNNEGLDIQGKNSGMMTSTLEGAKHVVQPGENLSKIAKKYNVTVPELMTWNGLSTTTPLRVNQELALSGTAQVLNAAGQVPQFQTHVVKKGETLSAVAKKYGVTVGDLKTINNLPNDMLSLNQKLKIGKASMLNQPANGMNNGVAINQNNQTGNNQLGVINANPIGGNLPAVANTGMSNQPVVGGTGTYSLSFGDSPYMVATKYGVAPEDVLRWNNLPADASAFPADMKVVYVADPTKVNSGATMGNALPQNNPNPGGGVFGNTPANNTGANGVVNNAGAVSVPADHMVNFGESPYSIAQKYNLNPADVLHWNKLAFDTKVQPGSTLLLHDPALPATNNAATNNAVMGNQGAGTTLNIGVNNQGMGISDPTIGTAGQGIQGTPVDINATSHIVQPTETLFGIARTYGVHVRDLYAWNGMNSESKLNSGQTIYIKEPPTEATGNLNQAGQGTAEGYYVTKAGDNVYGVAKQFGIPVTDLKKWNGIDYGVIDLQPGTPLIVNGKTAPIDPVTEAVYVSKPGDNIYKVSSGFKIKVTDLKRWNNLAPGVIDLPVGTKLKVSETGAVPQTEPLTESGGTGTDLPIDNGSQTGMLNQSAAPAQAEEGYYTAQAGDNIYGVSSNHSITVLDLKKWNHIPTGKIDLAPGTKLIVSAAAAQKEAALHPKPVVNKGVIAESANPNVKPVEKKQPEKKADPVAVKKGAKTHTVSRGETLSKIARDYKVTLKQLRMWNGLKESDDIQAGATLKVSKE